VGLPFSQTLFKDRQFWQVVGMLTASDDGISVEWSDLAGDFSAVVRWASLKSGVRS
jgi:hypothetical protein